ncbi:MAG: hypothetical protein R3E79_14895 [Caldilineaceae bacterium]
MICLPKDKPINRSVLVARNRNSSITDKAPVVTPTNLTKSAMNLTCPLSTIQRQNILTTIADLSGNNGVQRAILDNQQSQQKSLQETCVPDSHIQRKCSCSAGNTCFECRKSTNRSVSEVGPRTSQLQRDPIAGEPVIVVGARSKSRRSRRVAQNQQITEQQRSNQLLTDVMDRSERFINEWDVAAYKGIDNVPVPKEPEESYFWWMDLVGKFCSLTSAILAPELKTAVAVTKYLGAYLGLWAHIGKENAKDSSIDMKFDSTFAA